MRKYSFLLLSLLFVLTGNVWATDYELWIAGLQVTSENASMITGDGISGTVTYAEETNTLTLNNASIVYKLASSTDFAKGIESNIDGLTIQLIGYNSVYSDGALVLSGYSTTIKGPGSLSAYGIYGVLSYHTVIKKWLYIADGCTVNLYGSSIGWNTLYDHLIVQNATLTSKGGGEGAVCCYDFALYNSSILYPAGASLNNSFIGTGWHNPANDVHIVAEGSYGLKVGGAWVTSANADDILGDNTARYYPDIQRISLNGCSMNHLDSITPCIEVMNDFPNESLTIYTEGENTLYTRAAAAIKSDKVINIYGEGYLTVKGQTGFEMSNNLNITGNLHAIAIGTANSGILGKQSESTLSIGNADVLACSESNLYSAISGFSNLIMIDPLMIKVPSQGVYSDGNMWTSDHQLATRAAIGAPSYDLKIADTWVTQDNCSNITSPYITSGTVSYDPTSQTLTLNNVQCSISNDFIRGVDNYIDGLDIVLIGENTFDVHDNGIYSLDSLTIKGNGTLNVTSSTSCIVACQGLALEGSTEISLSTPNTSAITGGGLLAVNNNLLDANQNANSENSAISGFDDVTIRSGLAMMLPCGAKYGTVFHEIVVHGIITPGRAVITSDYYHLKVGPFWVGPLNEHNVMGDGRVSYNHETKTLTIWSISLNSTNCPDDHCIMNGINGLHINVVGSNLFYSSTMAGIFSEGDLTLEGAGTIVISCHDGIFMNSGNLTINDCIINSIASGSEYCGAVYGKSSYSLSINHAFIKATAPNSGYGSIFGFGSFSISNCTIQGPADAVWDNVNHCIAVNNTPVTSVVTIGLSYPLYVKGIQVKSINQDNILNDATNSVSYEPARKRLILNGAFISCINENGIYSELDSLTIKLEGENTIREEMLQKTGILTRGDLFFTVTNTVTGMGAGTLSITAKYGIYADAQTASVPTPSLTLNEDCTVSIMSLYEAIQLVSHGNPAGGVITVDLATLDARTTTFDKHAITCQSLVMNDAHITTPLHGTFSDGHIHQPSGNDKVSHAIISPTRIFNGLHDNRWEDKRNWRAEHMPQSYDDVEVDVPCEIHSAVTVNEVHLYAPGSLTICDGGQLFHTNDDLYATIQKHIEAYTSDVDTADGWYFIATPMVDGNLVSTVQVGTYDLYRFDDGAKKEWENVMKEEFTSLEKGRGYLYANSANKTLSFSGVLNATDGNVTLHVNGTDENAGWNLVGNPFPCNANIGDREFYVCDNAGIITLSENGTIPPCTAILIKATEDNEVITFVKGDLPSSNE